MASKKKQLPKPPRSAPEPMPRVAAPALDDTQPTPGIFIGEGGTRITGVHVNMPSSPVPLPSGLVPEGTPVWVAPISTGGSTGGTVGTSTRNPWTGTGFGVPGGVPSQPPPEWRPNPRPVGFHQRPLRQLTGNPFEGYTPIENMSLGEAIQVAHVLQTWVGAYLQIVLVPKVAPGISAEPQTPNELHASIDTVGAWCVRTEANPGDLHILGRVVDSASGIHGDPIFGAASFYRAVTGDHRSTFETISGHLRNERGITSQGILDAWQRIFS